MKRTCLTVMVLVLTSGLAGAQEKPQEKPQPQPAETPRTSVETPRTSGETPRREDSGQAVNIRLDVTITDQQGSAAPVVKTLSTLVADNWQSRLRTEGTTMIAERGMTPIALNLDARPRILNNTRDKILLMMTIEYKPTGVENKPGSTATTLNQSIQVILQDGQPLMISQSADPSIDRKVKLEVKATILR